MAVVQAFLPAQHQRACNQLLYMEFSVSFMGSECNYHLPVIRGAHVLPLGLNASSSSSSRAGVAASVRDTHYQQAMTALQKQCMADTQAS